MPKEKRTLFLRIVIVHWFLTRFISSSKISKKHDDGAWAYKHSIMITRETRSLTLPYKGLIPATLFAWWKDCQSQSFSGYYLSTLPFFSLFLPRHPRTDLYTLLYSIAISSCIWFYIYIPLFSSHSCLLCLHSILYTKNNDSRTCISYSQIYRISLGHSSLLSIPLLTIRHTSAVLLLTYVCDLDMLLLPKFLSIYTHVVSVMSFLFLFWFSHILFDVEILAQILYNTCFRTY